VLAYSSCGGRMKLRTAGSLLQRGRMICLCPRSTRQST
jgi:hypothetical protein